MKRIEDINILVIGDIMLDNYIIGTVERISPEAPVPIVKTNCEYSTLGGAGNVVRNLRELGANVTCIGSIGLDKTGSKIESKLKKLNVENRLLVENIMSIKKTRIIAERSTQLLRIDEEIINPVKIDNIDLSGDFDIIVISDYSKGMVTPELLEKVKKLNAKIILDPKPINGFSNLYENVFMITPNKKEYNQIYDSFPETLDTINHILITLGRDGIELISKDYDQKYYIEGEPVNVYNVSGCGDTIVAIMAVCVSMGLDIFVSSKIANSCAGYVAAQPGTSIVPLEIFKTKLKENL